MKSAPVTLPMFLSPYETKMAAIKSVRTISTNIRGLNSLYVKYIQLFILRAPFEIASFGGEQKPKHRKKRKKGLQNDKRGFKAVEEAYYLNEIKYLE